MYNKFIISLCINDKLRIGICSPCIAIPKVNNVFLGNIIRDRSLPSSIAFVELLDVIILLDKECNRGPFQNDILFHTLVLEKGIENVKLGLDRSACIDVGSVFKAKTGSSGPKAERNNAFVFSAVVEINVRIRIILSPIKYFISLLPM
jgi:hypothetical protein